MEKVTLIERFWHELKELVTIDIDIDTSFKVYDLLVKYKKIESDGDEFVKQTVNKLKSDLEYVKGVNKDLLNQ
jgi:hypothetical protein